jgi:hypothetical protein
LRTLLYTLCVLVGVMAGCGADHRTFGAGKVVTIDWTHRTVSVESREGFVFSFLPTCYAAGVPTGLPLWEGMEFKRIDYSVSSDMGVEVCTNFQGVQR